MDIISILFSMRVCCVFLLESPHRGDSNEYTQYTIFNIKRKSPLIIPNLQLWVFVPRDARPSLKQPSLKFYCSRL